MTAGLLRSLRLVVALLLGVTAATVGASAGVAADGATVVCRFTDSRLVEISGITWSRRHPGVYWVHNDSGGGPYLYAVDGRTCRTLARIRVSGIGARDMEAIATGTDPAGRSVLWVGDIGDNNDSWPSVRLHAVPEPARLVDQQVGATTYRFTYSDGSHNAEALLADPDEARVLVVTKQVVRGGVWRVPLSRGSVSTATRIGEVRGLVTDAAVSPDGRRYVIRDYLTATLHSMPVTPATLGSSTRVAIPGEPQGEAITFTSDGSALLVASERDAALYRVPLPAAAASPTASATTGSASGSPQTSAPAAGDATAGSDGGIGRLALAGAALLAAAAVGILAARRLRR